MFPSILVGLFVASCIFGIAVTSRAESLLKDFLNLYSAISNAQILNEYKVLARAQMKLALYLRATLCTAMLAMGSLIILKGESAFLSFPLLGLSLGFTNRVAKLEWQVKSLECADANLERQYQAINRTWKEKAFPDF